MPLPGGGWILLAAAIVPVVLSTAKPLARKIGKGLKDIGEKLMDEAEEKAAAKDTEAGVQSKPKRPAPKARTQRAKKPAAKKRTPAPPSDQTP